MLHHAVERSIFGEILQTKSERRVPVFWCKVIKTVTSQYCRFLSAVGVVRYLKFREAKDYCLAQMTIGSKEVPVTVGTSTSHSTFLAGDLKDVGDCSMSIIETKTGKKLGGQAVLSIILANAKLVTACQI
jgi:hypothetical protein